MPLLNYTTSVAPTRTAMQMSVLLAKHGAAAVATTLVNGKPVGLAFKIDTPYGSREFSMPVDTDAVFKVLGRQQIERKYKTREHAERVAWRIAKDWLEVQLAIVESQMVSIDQVMLPYMFIEPGKTLYQAYRDREEALQLTPGSA